MAPSGSVDGLWRKLEQLLKIGKLIPVFGPGCITFGPDDQPLYPWLAEQLVWRVDIEFPHGVESPLDLHTVAVAHLARRGGGRLDDISLELDILLDPRAKEVITPGPLLRDVCRVGAFSHFFTLAFDPLLERALGEVRYGGLRKPELWEYSLGQAPQDLPFAQKMHRVHFLAIFFVELAPTRVFTFGITTLLSSFSLSSAHCRRSTLLPRRLAPTICFFWEVIFPIGLLGFFCVSLKASHLKKRPFLFFLRSGACASTRNRFSFTTPLKVTSR